MWGTEDNFEESVLAFHPVEAGSLHLVFVVLRPGGKLAPELGSSPASAFHLEEGVLGLQTPATTSGFFFFFFLWVLRIELSLRHLASPKFCSLPPANLFHPLPSPTETVIPMSPPVPSLCHEPLSLIRAVWAWVEGSLLEYHQLISGYTAEETPPSTAQAAINYLQSLREACGLMNPLFIHDAS